MVLIPDIKDVPVKEINSIKQRLSPNSRKKILITVTVILIGLFTVSGIAFAQGRTLYQHALTAKAQLSAAKAAIKDKQFDTAIQAFQYSESELVLAQAASQRMRWMKWLPGVSTQFKAVDSMLAGGIKIASAAQEISSVAQDVFSVIKSDNTSINSISTKERKALLEKISHSPDQLTNAQQELNEGVMELENIPAHGVIAPLAAITDPIRENLPLAKEMVDKLLPLLRVAPAIVGYPNEQTYLFLLQNNRELRPTGGFIGTYGILILKNGDIQEFKTDNIYNLDAPVVHELYQTPPEPLGRYLKIDQWFMRDSNWDPNFPTTAQTAEQFYHLEHGPVETIDGVLAVTPTFIQDLMGLTGSITVADEEFTKDNVIDKIQYESEFGYRKDGKSDSARKEIIGQVAVILKDKLLDLPSSQWGNLWQILLKDLDQKQVLIYSKNTAAQQLVNTLGWDGSIQNPEGDFLMVVDANLAALKTDKVMVKKTSYSIAKEGQDYIVNLELTYQHTGIQDDDYITRYRTYTRIYVPEGSALLSTEGFLTDSEYEGGVPVAAKVIQDDTVHKTIFAGFISVEAQSTKVIKLRYKLAPLVIQQLAAGNYHLYLQKQPGTSNVLAEVSFDIGQPIAAIDPVDKLEKIGNNKVHFSSPLDVDKQLTIQLE